MDLLNNQQLDPSSNFMLAQKNKGVCYLSRIPPYMTPAHLRRLLKDYDVQRIYLLSEDQSLTLHRKRMGGNKRQKFTQGWVQFTDKSIAKLAALTLNAQPVASNKRSFYANDVWTIKYLPKFKWQNLTAKLAYEQRMKKERLKLQDNKTDKIQEHYANKTIQSKIVNNTIANKKNKGVQIDERFKNYSQQNIIQQEQR